MKIPKISIVTPSYNQGRFIDDAIQSVIKQNYPHVEHLIFDAQSTDETAEVAARYAHLPHLHFISEPDEGQSDAINKGFRAATGDIIAWLNADDFYMEGTFGRVAQQFAKGTADIVYGETAFVDAEGTTTRLHRSHAFDYQILLYYGCYIQSTTTFFKQEVVKKEELNPDYRVAMDHEYFVRLAREGFTYDFIPQVLAAFRWHGDNVSSTQKARGREERLTLQRLYSPNLPGSPKTQEHLLDLAASVFRLKRAARLLLHR